LSDITAGKLSVKSHTILTKPWPLNGTNCPIVAFTWAAKSSNKKQTCQPPRKFKVGDPTLATNYRPISPLSKYLKD